MKRRPNGDLSLWQRRFWEHTIRDESDFARRVDYIPFNPVKHALVPRVRDCRIRHFTGMCERACCRMTGPEMSAKAVGISERGLNNLMQPGWAQRYAGLGAVAPDIAALIQATLAN